MSNTNRPYPAMSFWERNSFFQDIDVLIIGSGIVGLNAAVTLKEKAPDLKVTVLEKGVLPAGASTRNAGFACFGSMTELIDDVQQNGESAMLHLVEKRWRGLQRLKERIGEDAIDYQEFGGYELFLPDQEQSYQECLDKRVALNTQLQQVIGVKEVFSEQNNQIKAMGFRQVKHLLFNRAEGQIDTGKMMSALLQLARFKGVELFNGIEVDRIEENGNAATAFCANGWELSAKRILICNNGFAKQLLPTLDVQPARNQVLITKPIPDLQFKGCFHYDSGYYYFRNVGNRILLGGGRNLAEAEETTTIFKTTPKIKEALVTLLNKVILPDQKNEIEMWWSGILGVGSNKNPILQAVSPSIIAAVRLGGMGVAIGSLTGEEGAKLVLENI